MRPRPRVLHVLPSMHGYGAERQIVTLLTCLRSEEIEAALLTVYAPDLSIAERLPFPVLHADRVDRKDVWFVSRLIREIRTFRPDIVHTHTHVGKYWGRVAAIAAGTPHLVHTEHNPCDARRTPLERVADRVLHLATDRIVTFFPEQGRALSRLDGFPQEKVAIIPNGLPSFEAPVPRADGRERLGISDDRFAIIVVGRMEYQKNQALALRAYRELGEEFRKDSLLFFAGAGQDESALRTLARELGLNGRVRFLGYRDDVPALLAGADLLLMTSHFEGMPLTLIEAMNSGLPIVSTPWIGARTMLGDGRFGFLCADYTPRAIAREIERARKYPATRQRVASQAREQAHRAYDIAAMVNAHHALYARLCEAT